MHFLCKVGPNHMFCAAAMNNALNLRAWGGIGACRMEGKKRQWQLHRVARASAAPDMGRGGGCYQYPTLASSFDGLHATCDGYVGVGISDLQGIFDLISSCLLPLNGPGTYWIQVNRGVLTNFVRCTWDSWYVRGNVSDEKISWLNMQMTFFSLSLKCLPADVSTMCVHLIN